MGLPQANVLQVRQVDVVARDADTLRPTKVRRLSEEPAASIRKRPKPPVVDVGGRGPPLKLKRERDKENEPQASSSTPVHVVAGSSSTAKRLGDYSAFKGRGRYAKDVASWVDFLLLPVCDSPDLVVMAVLKIPSTRSMLLILPGMED